MLKSQRDFTQACCKFMPSRQPEREFADYDQDELRLSMQKLTSPREASNGEVRIKHLMRDGRWRIAGEIARAVDASDARVRTILVGMEARGEIRSTTVDGTKCWIAVDRS